MADMAILTGRQTVVSGHVHLSFRTAAVWQAAAGQGECSVLRIHLLAISAAVALTRYFFYSFLCPPAVG